MNDTTFMLLTIYRIQLTLNYARWSLPQSKAVHVNTSCTLPMRNFSLNIINLSWLTDSNTLPLLNMGVELRLKMTQK